MRIDGLQTPRSTSAVRRKGGSASSVDFSSLLSLGAAAEAAPAAVTGETASLTATSQLFAIQEISEQEAATRQLAYDGDRALDRLEDLRHALLMGRLPVETLHQLASSMQLKRQQVSDPALLEIIDDIELRVAVELAKLEQSFTPETPQDPL